MPLNEICRSFADDALIKAAAINKASSAICSAADRLRNWASVRAICQTEAMSTRPRRHGANIDEICIFRMVLMSAISGGAHHRNISALSSVINLAKKIISQPPDIIDKDAIVTLELLASLSR